MADATHTPRSRLDVSRAVRDGIGAAMRDPSMLLAAIPLVAFDLVLRAIAAPAEGIGAGQVSWGAAARSLVVAPLVAALVAVLVDERGRTSLRDAFARILPQWPVLTAVAAAIVAADSVWRWVPDLGIVPLRMVAAVAAYYVQVRILFAIQAVALEHMAAGDAFRRSLEVTDGNVLGLLLLRVFLGVTIMLVGHAAGVYGLDRFADETPDAIPLADWAGSLLTALALVLTYAVDTAAFLQLARPVVASVEPAAPAARSVGT